MKIHWITVCHMNVEPMKACQEALGRTLTSEEFSRLSRKVFVDHRYPIGTAPLSAFIHGWADAWKADVIRPPRNLGGHGGVSYALDFIRPANSDIVFSIDPDSYPITPGWFTACIDALENDETLGSVSLLHLAIKNRPWQIEEKKSPRVAFLPHAEMWNMTAFRGKILQNGMLADRKFYGMVETAMLAKGKELGLRHGYLFDFLEAQNPNPQDAIYVKWKQEHGLGKELRNFDAYVRDTPLVLI